MSEDFVLLLDWTTVSTSKVCLRYCSPAGQYFNSLAAVQEFLACSGTTVGDADAGSGLSTDESGLEYFLTPRKGRQLEVIFEDIWQPFVLSSQQLPFAPLINQVTLGV